MMSTRQNHSSQAKIGPLFLLSFIATLLMPSFAQAVKVNRTILFYQPTSVFGDSLKPMNVRDANATMRADITRPDWWSVTLTGDSDQYNFQFNQNNFSVFFQVDAYGNSNQCYDLNGWRKADQSCSAKFLKMGSWPNDTMWIVPDFFDPKFTPDTFFTEPVFWTFYFLPPDDDDWQQGSAQMIIDGAPPVTMYADPDRCGWYKAVYYGNKPTKAPPTNLLFTLDADPDTWRVGAAGAEDPPGTPIDLLQQFSSRSPGANLELFFESDLGVDGWTVTDPAVQRPCGYPLAAFIYDTDPLLHPNFTLPCGDRWTGALVSARCTATFPTGTAGNLTHNESKCPPGVRKGIVQSTLGPDGKPRLNVGAANAKCFENETWFNALFNPTPNVNSEHCYNLPFSRSSDGLWEFDSYNSKNPDGSNVGGFYPLDWPGLDPAITVAPFNTKTMAECRVDVKDSLKVIDPTYGLPLADIYYSKEGDFGDGDNPGFWNWDNKYRRCALSSSVVKETDKGERNQHFCFASNAEFTYRPGQQFSFRGDDDIWVFINNKLVVDLGGVHLAAPGFVNLDTITPALTVGATYPIHIFFCDRKPTMSNVRIKTNMYFSQKNGLFPQTDAANPGSYTLCMETGSVNSCSAIRSGQTAVTKCGADIADQLAYYLKGRKDSLALDASNPACDASSVPGQMTCYGGITITGGKVTVVDNRINGLAGSYWIYAKVNDPNNPAPPPPVRVHRVLGNTKASVVSGLADLNGLPLDLTPPAQAVTGARVPVYFAVGDFDPANNRFIVDTEAAEAGGQTFALNQAAGNLSDAVARADLQIYTSATGGLPVLASQQFVIPASGLCTLWVTGSYRALTDYEYTLNVSGAKTTPVKINFRLPLLQFRDETFTTPVTPVGPTDRSIMMGITNSINLVALNPIDLSICQTCTFPLTATSWVVPDTALPRVVEFFGLNQTLDANGVATGGMVNGQASFSFSGAEPVQDPYWAFFKIEGLSTVTSAQWDSLRFKLPPIPDPVFAGMYDRNGDGIGDSLVIAYRRALPADSLPDHIKIWWPENRNATEDTLRIEKSELAGYWHLPGYADSLIVISGFDFSEKVYTKGVGRIISTATYFDPDLGVPVTANMSKLIEDRIPPIIIEAAYNGPTKGCGASLAQACLDQIKVKFSESVVLDSMAPELEKTNLFQYRYLEGTNWIETAIPFQAPLLQDSSALLLFQRYENGPRTPQALDSIKFRGNAVTLPLLRDLQGNFPSSREIGERIEGVKPLKIETNNLAYLDVKDPLIQARLDSSVVSVYPVPSGLSLDTIKTMFPGTVGHFVQVDVPGKLFTLTQGKDIKVNPGDINFYLETQYYTNLGAYTAGSMPIEIPCTDPVYFNGDCTANPRNLYVAWNLMSDQKRFVGSGAYISNLKFHWTVKLGTSNLTQDKQDITKVLGVSRGRGIIN